MGPNTTLGGSGGDTTARLRDEPLSDTNTIPPPSASGSWRRVTGPSWENHISFLGLFLTRRTFGFLNTQDLDPLGVESYSLHVS